MIFGGLKASRRCWERGRRARHERASANSLKPSVILPPEAMDDYISTKRIITP
ncbi:MAG: hypothetical protein M3430_19840 [Acidobacteriota bacterium]|nr:hypothetical protein [Acidobacteriota bacterium]